MVKLVFLGRFRELGEDFGEVALPADVRTLSALTGWLARSRPGLAEALAVGRTQFAVNQNIVRDPQHAIREGDEIAFLPPMSGG